MRFETPSMPDAAPETEKDSEALKLNVNTLIELFQINESTRVFQSQNPSVIEIGRIIQKHTKSIELGHNRIDNPEAFLDDIHAARDKMLRGVSSETERQDIWAMFRHVDIIE